MDKQGVPLATSQPDFEPPSGAVMMASLLDHLIEITGHRDHELLDMSVMTALLNMIGVYYARVLELFPSHGGLRVRPKIWICDGKIHTADGETARINVKGEAIESFPGLADCIAQRKSRMEEQRQGDAYVLWVPVWHGDDVFTCIEIVNRTPFTPPMLQIIEGILSVYRNFQSLLDYSERDSLTGLLNRKTFDEKFARMIANRTSEAVPGDGERRHHANVKSQWLAVVDIDHFKRVNDVFGHLYGDEVLILVANVLRSSFRAQDRIFRFGGEEFIIMLRSATLASAQMVFERFRENIEQHVFPQIGKITISIGFTSVSQETPVVILGYADQALYYAKEHGRNRVCYYHDLLDQSLLQAEKKAESVEFLFDQPAEN